MRRLMLLTSAVTVAVAVIGASAAETGSLILMKTETIFFDYQAARPLAVLFHSIGVSKTSTVEGERFTATVTDHLPPGAKILAPSGASWPAQSACKDPYKVSATLRPGNAGPALDLGFVDAPCLRPQAKADDCCGCGGEACARACSVTVGYSSSVPDLEPGRWARVMFKLSGQPLRVNQEGKVAAEIFTHVLSGAPAELSIWVPAKASNATVVVSGATDGAQTKRLKGGTWVSLPATASAGHLKTSLSVLPTKAGTLNLGGLMRAQVRLSEPFTTEAGVTGFDGPIKSSYSGSVMYQKSLVVRVSEAPRVRAQAPAPRKRNAPKRVASEKPEGDSCCAAR